MPLQLNRYSAYIKSDGKELEAFDVRVEDERTVSCWVASEEGKTFSINWAACDASSVTSMQVSTYVDGRHMKDTVHGTKGGGRADSIRENIDQRRPFMFAPLVLTDDEAAASTGVDEDLGTIRLEMRRVERWEKLTRQTPYCAANIAEKRPVHEKFKKAGVHTVAFGATYTTTPAFDHYTAVGLEKGPFAVFKFHYRPIALLQANEIAPRPETPANSQKRSAQSEAASDGEVSGARKRRRENGEGFCEAKPQLPKAEDEDDVDNLTFLREQLAQLQKRVEEAEASQRSRVAVKRETSPIRVPSSSSPEVIDLT